METDTIIENEQENVVHEDSSNEYISDSGTDSDSDTNVDNNVNEKSLEELLKDYIENCIENQNNSDIKEHDQENENDNSDKLSDDSEILSEDPEQSSDNLTETIDYTDLLNEIIESNKSINETNDTILQQQTLTSINNELSADIENISLTNFLLIMVFAAVLFDGVLHFAGGFFK